MQRIGLYVQGGLHRTTARFPSAMDGRFGNAEESEVKPADESPSEVNITHIAVIGGTRDRRLAAVIEKVQKGGDDQRLAKSSRRDLKGEYANERGGKPVEATCDDCGWRSV